MIINKLNDVLGVSGQNIAKIIAEKCSYLISGITDYLNNTLVWENPKWIKFIFELADKITKKIELQRRNI